MLSYSIYDECLSWQGGILLNHEIEYNHDVNTMGKFFNYVTTRQHCKIRRLTCRALYNNSKQLQYMERHIHSIYYFVHTQLNWSHFDPLLAFWKGGGFSMLSLLISIQGCSSILTNYKCYIIIGQIMFGGLEKFIWQWTFEQILIMLVGIKKR